MLTNKKILLTGLTGNVGGTVAEALAPGNELWGLARYSRPGQREHWDEVGVRTIVGDYVSGDMPGLPDDFDYVIHLGVNNTPATSDEGMRDNAEGVGLLMQHCRKAKAFLHMSTVGVYAQHPDPNHVYTEEDPLGIASLGHYNGSKIAGEGVARAMCRVLGLPTIICRLGAQYGHFSEGGIPAYFLRWMMEGRPIALRRGWSNRHALISNDDIVRFIEPALEAASVPATVVNFGGDENVSSLEIIDHLASMSALPGKWIECGEDDGFPSTPIDPSRRMAITGPCQVDWKTGLNRLYDAVHDRLREEVDVARKITSN